jgi:hypothetical protein
VCLKTRRTREDEDLTVDTSRRVSVRCRPSARANPGYNAGFGVTWWPTKEIAKLPSTNSWNFAVSRALGGNFVLDVTYAGSKGTHLASDRVNYMQIPSQYASLASLLNKPIDDPAVVARGFQPPFPNLKQLLGPRATLGQSLRLWPQYTSVGTGA